MNFQRLNRVLKLTWAGLFVLRSLRPMGFLRKAKFSPSEGNSAPAHAQRCPAHAASHHSRTPAAASRDHPRTSHACRAHLPRCSAPSRASVPAHAPASRLASLRIASRPACIRTPCCIRARCLRTPARSRPRIHARCCSCVRYSRTPSRAASACTRTSLLASPASLPRAAWPLAHRARTPRIGGLPSSAPCCMECCMVARLIGWNGFG